MTVDPRAALSSFVSALERHLEASATRRGENDPTVVAAYRDLADAFETYDEALLQSYGEVTPLEIYAGDEDDDDDDGFDDDFDDDDDDDDDDIEYEDREYTRERTEPQLALRAGVGDVEYDEDDSPRRPR